VDLLFTIAWNTQSILGGLVPKAMIPESWRIPMAALLIAAGIALAVIAFS
jgi:hypothetical protein